MAIDDYIEITANGAGSIPAGKRMAVDTVDGREYQRFKLDLGDNDATDPVIGSVPVNDGGNTITVDNDGTFAVQTSAADSASVDAFSRTRMSVTAFRSDAMFTYNKLPELFDEITTNGTVTHDADLGAVYLSTGGTTDGNVATFRQHFASPYTPGSGQLIFITGTANPDNVDSTNAKFEIGYGYDDNAIGFRYTNGVMNIFIRSSISGTAADINLVAQTAWDNPVADVDWTKSQIFGFDFQSLAVGRVRFYMDRDGVLVKVHEITNDNIRVGPYWSLPSLPPYWKVENTGTANATLRGLAICETVKSEGGVDLFSMPGIPYATPSMGSLVTVSTTVIPIISIQLKTTLNSITNRGIVLPISLEVFSNDRAVEVIPIINGGLTGDSFTSINANSIVDYDTAATAITGGRDLPHFFVSGGQRGGVAGKQFVGRIPLSNDALGTTGDILTLAAVRASTQDAAIKAAIGWEEIR